MHRSTSVLPEIRPQSGQIDHSLFDRLLKLYVNEKGQVDYAGLKESGDLTSYIDQLEVIDPDTLSKPDALAFWINAYNAFTIKLIVDHYPVGSIREIAPFRIKGLRLAIPKINSPFQMNVAQIGGRAFSLDDIEHGILRKRFDEPRIHFAIVCASVSCPILRREAYTAERLDAQLADQAKTFLHDSSKNEILASEKTIRLSKIFKWFQNDFADTEKDLQRFLAPYFEGEVQEKLERGDYRVRYRSYNWSLNDARSRF